MGSSIRLGVFVLVALAVLVWFVFLIGNAENRFGGTYRLRAEFQNVSGLEEGAEVRVGGLHSGTVRTIQLPAQPGGKLTVVMDLANRTEKLVKQDSVASIEAEGMVGSKYVEVSFGTPASPPARGGTIQSQPPIDISDLLGKTN